MPNIIRIICNTKDKITLKKTYNITLLNIFPLDLENIIHDYVDDIIEVNIIHFVVHACCHFRVINQYINYNEISFDIVYHFHQDLIDIISTSSNIIEQLLCSRRIYPYTVLINNYMKRYYNHTLYFNCALFHKHVYGNHIQKFTYNNNVMTYHDDYYKILKPQTTIRINNHKLFKNMIVIIKCIQKIDNIEH